LRIFKAIVFGVPISMVNNFVWLQKSAQMLFHHKAVLSDVSGVVGVGVIGLADQDVFALFNSDTVLPVSVMFAVARATWSLWNVQSVKPALHSHRRHILQLGNLLC